MDAGFLYVVLIEQYFITKHSAEFSQVTDAVACREYTLLREEQASQPKGWIPFRKFSLVCCKVNVELRSESCL